MATLNDAERDELIRATAQGVHVLLKIASIGYYQSDVRRADRDLSDALSRTAGASPVAAGEDVR